MVRSWWLNGRATAALLKRTAETIQYQQQRNAAARRSHTKTTRRKLRQMGIKLTSLIRCKWP